MQVRQTAGVPFFMRAPSDEDGGLSAGRLLKLLGLLWLAGIASRVTILAVPPVIPLIHADLHMTETQVGGLIGIPLVMFALAAVPGSILISRFGAVPILMVGILVAALAGAARGVAPNIWLLYLASMLMGFGVAIVQPTLPTLIRAWVPARIGLATAVTTNGMMVGIAAPPALTLAVVLPLVGGSWRMDFVFWSIPAFLTLLLLAFSPRPQRPVRAHDAPPQSWWPDWKNPVIWLLGFTFGSNNALYYAANAFLPDYLTHTGRPELIGHALGWLNGAQFIASVVMLGITEYMHRRVWPYLLFGPLALVGLFGIVLGSGWGIVLAASLVGFSLAVTFVMTLALAPVVSPAGEVHRVAGGMFTISYSCAVVIPILSGALWDLTGVAWTTFLPMGVCALALTSIGVALTLRSFPRARS
jgi:CP family cyanate transporter-like MFS transporter